MTPLTVKLLSPPMDASAANTAAPLATPLPKLSVNAPTPALTPSPDKLRLLATVFPLRSKLAPSATVTVPVPNGPLVTVPVLLAPACKVPADKLVPPL